MEDEDDVGHTSRSSSLLRMEASQDMVSQSGVKISESAMVSGARDTITEVAVEDGWVDVTGCIGPRYHFFDVFIVLGIMSSLVF
jgi:hypothetical protein